MRHALGVGLGVLAATTLLCETAFGQGGGALRRFTEHPTESNRPNRIVYAPLAWAFPGRQLPDMPRDVSVASWYQVPVNATNQRPDKVLDDSRYTLERMELVQAAEGQQSRIRVVITQRPAPASDLPPPRVSLVHPSQISSIALATQERLPDGVRFTALVTPPLAGFAPSPQLPGAQEYSVRLLPARDVDYPDELQRAPTFAGVDIETRMSTPPPRLPRAERVAGKRLEYRRGRVIDRSRR